MKNILIATLALALAVTIPTLALAQSGGGYDLTWSTIDGGGGASNGGVYLLGGTAGQPDAEAMTGGGYDLPWNTIDNGGSEIGYGGYTLNGAIGQPDANAPLSNSGYTLTGGFWFSAVTQQRLYLPLVLKSG